jgi:hypothetical protein
VIATHPHAPTRGRRDDPAQITEHGPASNLSAAMQSKTENRSRRNDPPHLRPIEACSLNGRVRFSGGKLLWKKEGKKEGKKKKRKTCRWSTEWTTSLPMEESIEETEGLKEKRKGRDARRGTRCSRVPEIPVYLLLVVPCSCQCVGFAASGSRICRLLLAMGSWESLYLQLPVGTVLDYYRSLARVTFLSYIPDIPYIAWDSHCKPTRDKYPRDTPLCRRRSNQRRHCCMR